jgi:hypothetical protein
MTLTTRVLEFIQNAQPGDSLALSTDACCEMRQGIYLAADRLLDRRDLVIYCPGEAPVVMRYGGAGNVLACAQELAARTGRELEQ